MIIETIARIGDRLTMLARVLADVRDAWQGRSPVLDHIARRLDLLEHTREVVLDGAKCDDDEWTTCGWCPAHAVKCACPRCLAMVATRHQHGDLKGQPREMPIFCSSCERRGCRE